ASSEKSAASEKTTASSKSTASTASSKQTSATSASKSGKEAPASPIDLNTASEKDLESLPGVGPATAKKIVAGRPYSSVSDLSNAGVPGGAIWKISSMVRAGAGAAASSGAPSGSKNPSAAPAPAESAPASSTSSSAKVQPKTTDSSATGATEAR